MEGDKQDSRLTYACPIGKVEMSINNRKIKTLVDTSGAEMSIIPDHLADQLVLLTTEVFMLLRGIGGHFTPIIGISENIPVTIFPGYVHLANLFIVKGLVHTVLGRPFLDAENNWYYEAPSSDEAHQDLDILAAHAVINDHFDTLDSDMMDSGDKGDSKSDNGASKQSDIPGKLAILVYSVLSYQAYPGSPHGFPRSNYADYTVAMLVDPCLRYNLFRLFPDTNFLLFPLQDPQYYDNNCLRLLFVT
ncbi:hypothetical protein PTTG_25162 [Puccinia triticina 1-1 BBBD Race 1]|uniref:Peptidase A2 domain-containing protein n=1 Tax=Puccinia triticina (isolate 1-1 / race 1 (BBBD)) TaxID=630390 RepID=A0A180H6C5_PUCT1|nr:hypothetical protein PTTG_25162 [Puccinia triticina 1-1 BBBD Race 1]